MSTQRGSLPPMAKLAISSGSIEIDRAAVHPQGLADTGNEEQQRDARIAHDVAQAIDTVVAGAVRDGERLVVEDAHKAGRVAFGRAIEPFRPAVATATNGAASISLR